MHTVKVKGVPEAPGEGAKQVSRPQHTSTLLGRLMGRRGSRGRDVQNSMSVPVSAPPDVHHIYMRTFLSLSLSVYTFIYLMDDIQFLSVESSFLALSPL